MPCGAREVFWDGPQRAHLSTFFDVLKGRPGKSSWSRRHKMRCPIGLAALQDGPVGTFRDRISACNLHPGLPTVVDGEGDVHLPVLAWFDARHRYVCCVVPLLP